MARKLTDSELKERAAMKPQKGASRFVQSTYFERDPWISECAKRKAHGKCQLCGEVAPFNNKQGQPYLETHHIEWLSKGGEDSIENTGALCPNCHRKMHIVGDTRDISKLKRQVVEESS